jgi:predicted transcriptional regulator
MSTVDAFRSPLHVEQPDPAEARRQRLAREAEMIAEARADVAAGRVVSLADVAAWIESWDTEHELPRASTRL